MKVLLIGSGGREHAIAWKLAQSQQVHKIYCAPGNGGTAMEDKCENVDITEIDGLLSFAEKNNIDITVVGPEAPLINGIADRFKEKGLKIFGPSKKAAMLEGSKAYAKEFMKKYKVKTAAYEVFEDYKTAEEYLQSCSFPIVVKADGLAAGKGVVICNSYEEAKETIESFMIKDIFKGAGKKLVIEEYLKGFEASILAVTDGKSIIPMLSAKDHKTIYENNEGPNTGGMGAVSPNPYFTNEMYESFKHDIIAPTLRGIRDENMDYIGIIFFGVMINEKGVYLLEYNVRMGDPETQAVLPLMESDFMDIINKAINGALHNTEIAWKDRYSCCIVAASEGYPGEYNTGFSINGTEKVKGKVFIAGAKKSDRGLLTTGGRVLCVTCIGNTFEEAADKAYKEIKVIDFKGIYYRKDIGKK
ncbi:phosphoribosylamine--glycine ligase [Candidatus Clostridium radicumherbarum]|uniref:Phosphoribosylamine--glycine ligase n=1 Tax=Candidatus Clostridium radicumherbarum TaxID=3381662 RepID=A0ABW8TU02_9CLOT